MGRSFVVLAALAAFTVSLSACKCPTPSADSGGSGGGAAASGTATSGTVCVDDVPSAARVDSTSSYRKEGNRNMSRLVDNRHHSNAPATEK